MTDDNRDRERVRETERTTIVDAGGERRGGGGGLLAAVLLILVVLALAFFFFRGGFDRAADKVGVNVNVDVPKVSAPNVDIKMPEKIELDVPKVDVKTEGQGNSAH
jgi:hypothetical protein